MTPDREKVIKALQNCSVQNDVGCQCCPYLEERKTYGHEWCTTSMAQDTLALLKEQKAVEPTWQQGKAYCGACGKRIPLKIGARFCHKCGKPISWEGR